MSRTRILSQTINFRRNCVMTGLLVVLSLFCSADLAAQTAGQNAFEARMSAMQAARQRVAGTVSDSQVQPAAFQQPAAGSATRSGPVTQPRGQVIQQQPRVARQAPARQAAVQTPGGYTPQHLRTAQLFDGAIPDGTIVGGDIPLVGDGTIISNSAPASYPSVIGGPVVGAPVSGGGTCGGGCGCGGNCGGATPIGSGFIDSGVVYEDSFIDDCGCAGSIGCDSCFDRGGCSPGATCWFNGIGRLFRNAEFFAGATGFQGAPFSVGTPGTTLQDRNFGIYEGFNLGLPLCPVSCGAFSGQIGVRAVQSNFNGNAIADSERDQLFVTAGVFRRVDQGLQYGIVYDFLRDESFTDIDVGQVRGDIGLVSGVGSTIGFRFSSNVTDDISGGSIDGTAFTGLATSTADWYRGYYRKSSPTGGWGEIFGGGGDNFGLFGISSDIPVGNIVALQSGFTYFIGNENGLGGEDADAWNLYVGVSLRPRGFNWYKFYDQPLLPVADNGTLLLQR